MKDKEMPYSIKILIEAYDLLNEVIRNPYKMGYIAIVTKIKPKSEEPIDLKLFDFRNDMDDEIIYIAKKIFRKIKLDNLPGGIKK